MGVKEYNLIETILNVELINFMMKKTFSKMNVECVLVIREDYKIERIKIKDGVAVK